MSEIKIGSEWVQKKKTPKEFEVVVISGDSLMVKENGEGFAIPWYISDFLENHEPKPVVDDTFNDDTPAQTFSALFPTDEAKCPECERVVLADSIGALFMTSSSGVCNYCSAKYSREKLNDDTPAKKYGPIQIRTTAYSAIKIANAGKMRLIGIAGRARSGKDTLASYLLSNLDGTWLRSSFADPLKNMLTAIGVDCSDDAKAVIDECFGATPRHMMQTLSTEWGRHAIDSDIWVKAFARLNAGKCVIVPDVRFENEADLVREHGVLIHLVGRGGIEGSHASENPIDFKEGDIVIDNSRDLAWLHAQVDSNSVLGGFVAEVSE